MRAKLIDRREVAEGTLAFELEPTGGLLELKAGQVFDITLPQMAFPDPKGPRRTFSVASSPADPRLLFAMRKTGSGWKRSLAEMPPGAEVDLVGPYGSFTLHRNAARPAVLLGGGIGVTPFRSMVKDAAERRLPHRLLLLYSNRDAASAPFLDDFARWAAELPSFSFAATLTRPRPGQPWTYETGRIDEGFLRRVLSGMPEATYYVAGPEGFVYGMQDLLPTIGVDPDSIRSEEFTGY